MTRLEPETQGMVAAVIFDMDGLLVDSEPVWDKARSMMARAAGKSWNSDDHKAVMGVSTQEWVDYMIRRLDLTMAPQAVEAQIIAQMVALYERKIPFFKGAIEAVALAAEAFPTGLASGSPRQLIDTVTRHPALAEKFKAIFSADQVGRGKPAPDVYLAAAAAMGVAPHDCVCLEDSGNGILAGKNAGMRVIAVPDPRFPPSAEKLAQADVVLESLAQVSLKTLFGWQ
jgi:HAD superfamily hydrolase (TIGR01509 family)